MIDPLGVSELYLGKQRRIRLNAGVPKLFEVDGKWVLILRRWSWKTERPCIW